MQIGEKFFSEIIINASQKKIINTVKFVKEKKDYY